MIFSSRKHDIARGNRKLGGLLSSLTGSERLSDFDVDSLSNTPPAFVEDRDGTENVVMSFFILILDHKVLTKQVCRIR